MSKIFIRLKNKETNQESKEVPIEDIIFSQNDIELERMQSE